MDFGLRLRVFCSQQPAIPSAVADAARIAVGYRSDQLDFGAYTQSRRLGGEGIVIEITLSR